MPTSGLLLAEWLEREAHDLEPSRLLIVLRRRFKGSREL